MQSVTNYFLFNLSLADLTMASLNGAPNFIYMVQKEWIFGTILCMVNNFVATLTVSSCVFTMTAISIDRYLAIIRPLKPRMTRGLARRAIGTIWLCSATLALPSLIFSETMTFPVDSKSDVCVLRWPDGENPSKSYMDLGYNICLLFVTYILPMMAMAICYGAMSKELWRLSQIGESTQRQLESLVSKRKIVRMFIVIVTTFGICWFPYHAYFVYQNYDGSIVYKVWAQHLYLSFYWLAMSTSMINPIVYYFMNSRFRDCIRDTASKFYCCCYWSISFRAREESPHFCNRRRESLLPADRETPCSHSSGGTQNRNRVTLHQNTYSNHINLLHYTGSQRLNIQKNECTIGTGGRLNEPSLIPSPDRRTANIACC